MDAQRKGDFLKTTLSVSREPISHFEEKVSVCSLAKKLKDIEAILSDRAVTENPSFEALCIAAEAMSLKNSEVLSKLQSQITSDESSHMDSMVARRLKREPLQYILENWSFMDFDLFTLPGALIPRQDTETLLEESFKIIEAILKPDFSFADVGSGSGAIGISLLRRFPKSKGLFIDISEQALAITEKNLCSMSGFSGRYELLLSDLFSSLQENSEFDLIFSNPPYIPTSDIAELMPEVRDYEPLLALDGGKDGLDVIRRLLKDSKSVLKPRGLLVFEHGADQREKVSCLAKQEGWRVISLIDDAMKRPRGVILELPR
ncbi:MAG: peptide chain release factor N(5)-glutamine methyltransferase [Candidatus Riflebacteria bacterium]|nr:peptide chain release factor N(5)-glutamine methyltransferase [Candidatus Riflebacteria bacterium]